MAEQCRLLLAEEEVAAGQDDGLQAGVGDLGPGVQVRRRADRVAVAAVRGDGNPQALGRRVRAVGVQQPVVAPQGRHEQLAQVGVVVGPGLGPGQARDRREQPGVVQRERRGAATVRGAPPRHQQRDDVRVGAVPQPERHLVGDGAAHAVPEQGDGQVETTGEGVGDRVGQRGHGGLAGFGEAVLPAGVLNGQQLHPGGQQRRPAGVRRGGAARVRETHQP